MKEFRRGMMYVNSVGDIPEGEHWIALRNQSVHIPGDERSRTHPGHGYPAHTDNYLSMIVFENKEAMEEWVRKEEEQRYQAYPYKILFMRTPQVTTRIEVSID